MKKSRSIVIKALLFAVLFAAGGIVGSIFPGITRYIIIAASCLAAVILIYFGYTGAERKARREEDVFPDEEYFDGIG